MDVSNAVNPSEPFGPKGVRPFRFPGILSISSKVIQRRLVFWRQTAGATSSEVNQLPADDGIREKWPKTSYAFSLDYSLWFTFGCLVYGIPYKSFGLFMMF